MNKIHYCPISQIQRKFGLYITGAGHEVTRPGEAYPHEYHASDYFFTWKKGRKLAEWEYQILYIREGRGTIEFKRGESIPLEAGSVIFLHPGEWHRYRPDPDTGWKEAYIGIGGEYMERFTAKPFFSDPPTVIKVEPDGRFDRDLLDLVGEIQARSAEKPYSLALKTLLLATALFEKATDGSGKDSGNTVIRKANLHIARHLGEIVDFPALARRFGMSYTLFRKKFQAYNGMAPLEYQITLRIRRACNMLASSSMPIAQIAQETGFRSPAYFSKFFRARTGLSPTRFRNRHIEDA